MARFKTKKASIIAMIPARMGSTRLAMKNLAMVGGKPMIYYAIKAAKNSGMFDKIILNSEHDIFAKIAARYKIAFYKRSAEWASSNAKSDSVVYDFVKNNPCEIVAWINTTSPLQTAEEVRHVVEYFKKEKLDSLITVRDDQVHCIYKGRPVNFRVNEVFAQTQDLVPVRTFVYSVMMWRSKVFVREFDRKVYAFFCGKTGVYPVSKLSAMIVKRQEDLMLADSIMRNRNNRYEVKYDMAVKAESGKCKKLSAGIIECYRMFSAEESSRAAFRR